MQTKEHLPALVAAKGNFKAVYSRSGKSASILLSESKRLGVEGIDLYSEDTPGHQLDDLLKRQDIKAVILALPIPVQPDIIRRCFAAGKHVLSEKPIAKDVRTARLLLQDYREKYADKNIIFNVAEQFRYMEGADLARTWIVDEKTVGQLTQVHLKIWRNVKAGGRYYETEWRKSPQYQGGFLLDGGVHHVAFLRYVSGQEIIETRGFARQVAAHMPPLDTVNAGILLSGGATGTFSMSFSSTKGTTEYFFIGTEGTLSITEDTSGTTVKLEDINGRTMKKVTVQSHGVEREIKAFLEAVERGKAESRAGPEEALNDLAVIESLCSGGGKVDVVEI
jgi:predicted dehydrogenase